MLFSGILVMLLLKHTWKPEFKQCHCLLQGKVSFLLPYLKKKMFFYELS